jgi:hypothetical protein
MGNSKLCLSIAVLLCIALPAFGHAVLVSATPNFKEVMAGPDVRINLRFNARIDGKRSSLILVTPKGEQRTLAISETTSPDSLGSEATGLAGGAYVLRWQVLAADGHISRGEVAFRVQ